MNTFKTRKKLNYFIVYLLCLLNLEPLKARLQAATSITTTTKEINNPNLQAAIRNFESIVHQDESDQDSSFKQKFCYWDAKKGSHGKQVPQVGDYVTLHGKGDIILFFC